MVNTCDKIEQFWKDVALASIVNNTSRQAITHADMSTLEYIRRFYSDIDSANEMSRKIRNCNQHV